MTLHDAGATAVAVGAAVADGADGGGDRSRPAPRPAGWTGRRMRRPPGPRIVVALDYPSADAALAMARRIDPVRCRVKVGMELFSAAGPAVLEALHRLGFEVFLDLKFHDIPNTVAGACRAAAAHGVWMANVHAGGGRRMMEAARDAADGGGHRPLIVAVTVLTSMNHDDLAETGAGAGLPERVRALARLAGDCGLDGVVCSAADLGDLGGTFDAFGPGFLRVTPGIRLAGDIGDQRRVATPGEAVRAGASHIVVGRPITAAPDPLAALAAVERDVATDGG